MMEVRQQEAVKGRNISVRDVVSYMSDGIYIRNIFLVSKWNLAISHLRHRLRIFLFRREVIFCSQDIQVFVFLTIP